jgi:hypothetical protein
LIYNLAYRLHTAIIAKLYIARLIRELYVNVIDLFIPLLRVSIARVTIGKDRESHGSGLS